MRTKDLEKALNSRAQFVAKNLVLGPSYRNEDGLKACTIAAQKGYVEVIKAIISRSMSKDAGPLLKNAMSIAASRGDLPTIRQLFRNGYEALYRDNTITRSAILAATAENQLEVLRLFEMKGIPMDVTILKEAFIYGHAEIVDFALKKKFKIKDAFKEGLYQKTGLTRQAYKQALVMRPMQEGEGGIHPVICFLVNNFEHKWIKTVIKNGFDLSYGIAIFLESAMVHRDQEILSEVLKYDIPASVLEKLNVLEYALETNDMKLANLCVSKGVKIPGDGTDLLKLCILHNNVDMAKVLMKKGVKERAGDFSPFRLALDLKNYQFISLFSQRLHLPIDGSSFECFDWLASTDTIEAKLLCNEVLSRLGHPTVELDSPFFYVEATYNFKQLPKCFVSTQSEATRFQLLKYTISLFEDINQRETASDDRLIDKARKMLDDAIIPDFNDEFQSKGGIEGVEYHIKSEILRRIIEECYEAINQCSKNLSNIDSYSSVTSPSVYLYQVVDYIQQNYFDLVKGDETRRKEFLNLTKTSRIPISLVAWRAYESMAPTLLFENLLTKPLASMYNADVFSTPRSRMIEGDGDYRLYHASHDARYIAAMTFLAAKKYGVVNDWIAQIYNIRIANNEDDYFDNESILDNPSCVTGVLSRCVVSLSGTKYKIPQSIYDLAKEVVFTLVKNTFVKALDDKNFMGEVTEESLLFLLDSILCLHIDYANPVQAACAVERMSEGGINIDLTDGKKGYSREHLYQRKTFIEYYFGKTEVERIDYIKDIMKDIDLDVDSADRVQLGLVINRALSVMIDNNSINTISDICRKKISIIRKQIQEQLNNNHVLLNSSDEYSNSTHWSYRTSKHSKHNTHINVLPLQKKHNQNLNAINPFSLKRYDDWLDLVKGDHEHAKRLFDAQNSRHKLFDICHKDMPGYDIYTIKKLVDEIEAARKECWPTVAFPQVTPHVLKEVNLNLPNEILQQLNNRILEEFDSPIIEMSPRKYRL